MNNYKQELTAYMVFELGKEWLFALWSMFAHARLRHTQGLLKHCLRFKLICICIFIHHDSTVIYLTCIMWLCALKFSNSNAQNGFLMGFSFGKANNNQDDTHLVSRTVR